MEPTHIVEGNCFKSTDSSVNLIQKLLHRYIQNYVSPCKSWHCGPDKLTYKINHHSLCRGVLFLPVSSLYQARRIVIYLSNPCQFKWRIQSHLGNTYKLAIYLKALTLLPLKCLFQISFQFIPQFPQLPLLFDTKATGTERALKSRKSQSPNIFSIT